MRKIIFYFSISLQLQCAFPMRDLQCRLAKQLGSVCNYNASSSSIFYAQWICQVCHPESFPPVITVHVFMEPAKSYSFTHGQPVLTWPPSCILSTSCISCYGSVYISISLCWSHRKMRFFCTSLYSSRMHSTCQALFSSFFAINSYQSNKWCILLELK
jgi:hypothetical protein